MQKISKWVQNYSKYHSKIFAGKYDKIAGNQLLPAKCRQSPCLAVLCTLEHNTKLPLTFPNKKQSDLISFLTI